MVLGFAVDLSVLFYLLCPFPGPHRAGVPGRLVPVGSNCASRRRAVSKDPVYPRSETRVGVRSVVWPGFPVEEAGRSRKRALFFGQAFRSERWAGVRSERCSSTARPSGRRGGPKLEASAIPLWPVLPVGDWIALLACRLGIWASPGVERRSQCCLLGRTFGGKPVHDGPRVYEPDTKQAPKFESKLHTSVILKDSSK